MLWKYSSNIKRHLTQPGESVFVGGEGDGESDRR